MLSKFNAHLGNWLYRILVDLQLQLLQWTLLECTHLTNSTKGNPVIWNRWIYWCCHPHLHVYSDWSQNISPISLLELVQPRFPMYQQLEINRVLGKIKFNCSRNSCQLQFLDTNFISLEFSGNPRLDLMWSKNNLNIFYGTPKVTSAGITAESPDYSFISGKIIQRPDLHSTVHAKKNYLENNFICYAKQTKKCCPFHHRIQLFILKFIQQLPFGKQLFQNQNLSNCHIKLKLKFFY